VSLPSKSKKRLTCKMYSNIQHIQEQSTAMIWYAMTWMVIKKNQNIPKYNTFDNHTKSITMHDNYSSKPAQYCLFPPRNPSPFCVCVRFFFSSAALSHYSSLRNTLPEDCDFLATACHQTFGTSSTLLPPSLFVFSGENWLFCLHAVLYRATVAQRRAAQSGPNLY